MGGGTRMVGWYPVLLGTTGSNLRPSRVGLVFIAQDLSALKAQGRWAVQSQAVQFSFVIVGLSLLFWLFFDIVLAHRVRRLIGVTERLAAGDMTARSHLTGRDEIGEIGRAFDHMADEITRAREGLQASEKRFRRVVESNMIGIVFWNELGEITEANDAFLQIVGYPSDDLNRDQLAWSDITPQGDPPFNRILLTKFRETRTCAPFEQVLIRKDGSQAPVVIGGSLL
ncbi:MAG: HAMP domain-containing protein, partial [Nitrospirota bacterium]